MSSKPRYGRWFKDGTDCYLGYFSYNVVDNEIYKFSGKGMHYKESGELVAGSEGLYKVSDALDKPTFTGTIDDFRDNDVPE